MTQPRIFYLGATGYVGGHAFNILAKNHPECQIVALVRNDEQATKLKAAFPTVEAVLGDLDSTDVLIREASRANVIINAASSDHSPGAEALIQGLGQGRKGYLVHISGTGILHDVSTGFGNESAKIYRDTVDGDMAEIVSFDPSHPHGDTENVIRTTAKAAAVPFAILCPPLIYGIGKGVFKTRSIQIPLLVEAAMKRGKAFQILEGQNIWDNVHIDDVAQALVLLAEEALKGEASKAQWGEQGYYFAEAAEHRWGTIIAALAGILFSKGRVSTPEVDKVSAEDASRLHPWGPLLWGGNCRSRAERIRKLGWEPRGPGIDSCLEEMVDKEIEAFGTGEKKLTFDK
ncbi:hypothetical protein GP486_000257 [Trichoglossum hirsutum]|uniref:NAD(P)-binding domain-containing protein n=1 Tax=Trichoglossum hirsutum TaxID=265104 RepID=A0A9P8LJ44_9PEZI|nr:hypothetical protein GP486_000257 [Trichoglossum hirsutum]